MIFPDTIDVETLRKERLRRPANGGPCIVILYNDDQHNMEEVVMQLMKATGYPVQRCVEIMMEAHLHGRAVAFSGEMEECEKVAAILRQIRLQVETDKF